jgi:tRNA modification GTPase
MKIKLKDYNLKDTICAIATFPSKSALGVIKISGKKSLDIVNKIFIPKKKKDIKKAKTYTIHYGWIVDKSNKKRKFIDEVLVSIMRAPFSYTCEDVVEISSHGGILVLNRILELILKNKARLALPGEFTYRAFVNGRINLLEAESISAIVEAKSDYVLDSAVKQLRGEGEEKIKILKEQLKEIFAKTESLINFPEEEDVKISLKDIKKDLEKIEKEIEGLLKRTEVASILKEGLKCVICGKANAGKSTLFNRLLKQERVIVSKTPGTTRDVIEETIDIKGVPLKIYDTAGIFEPKDLITKKAIEKTKRTFEEADLVLFVLDNSRPLNRDDLFLWERAKDKNLILVINKIDLKQKLKLDRFKSVPKVYLSALKNIGIKDLEDSIFKMIYKEGLDRENLLFLNNFQKEILKKIKGELEQTKKFLEENYPIDFINFSLKECLDQLRKLTGEVMCEEILENIFSNFCIGK